MKLFLVIAIVAIVAIVIISLTRGGTRVTHIERRRERDEDIDG